jgi:hypothetical protein
MIMIHVKVLCTVSQLVFACASARLRSFVKHFAQEFRQPSRNATPHYYTRLLGSPHFSFAPYIPAFLPFLYPALKAHEPPRLQPTQVDSLFPCTPPTWYIIPDVTTTRTPASTHLQQPRKPSQSVPPRSAMSVHTSPTTASVWISLLLVCLSIC